MSDISEQPVNFDLDQDFKCRLKRNEPLAGEALDFALSILGEFNFARSGELSTADKLKTGQKLNDYELYNMTSALIPDFKRGERKRFGARCGHVKRRIMRDEPLTGVVLELALEVLGNDNFAESGEPSTADKMIRGQKLNDYEKHMMVNVLLVHTKISSG